MSLEKTEECHDILLHTEVLEVSSTELRHALQAVTNDVEESVDSADTREWDPSTDQYLNSMTLQTR